MKKEQYLKQLKNELEKLSIKDVDDIVFEYAQHFDFKMADGFLENEIAVRLGDPSAVAAQFGAQDTTKHTKSDNAELQKSKTSRSYAGSKIITYTGLSATSTVMAMFVSLFALWALVLMASATVFAVGGVTLIVNVNIANLIPPMPYICRLLFGLTALPASLLLSVAALYCSAYIKQLCKGYMRWHKNAAAQVKGKPVLPMLSLHPRFSPKTKRILRNVLIATFAVFGIAFIISYAVAALKAGNFEFWHVWNWFVK